ncbi:hypothetical protein ACL02S_08415 [Nocardia sp. 004]|uniref:hypothetical protein n=1 Tax=Nocardia sp. 004 TaxID=3385978 RepID=UPI0039A1D741
MPLLSALRLRIADGAAVAVATTMDTTPDWKLLSAVDTASWGGVDRDARALLTTGRSGIVGSDECATDSARTPEETVIAIVAQILTERGGAAARPLNRLSGPIHR